MTFLFCMRPATRNIGNDVINRATSDLLLSIFGEGTGIVNIPALKGPQFGGFTAAQVYDMNRFADGVVLGGGNLFENGQVTIDPQALAALQSPLLIIGLSHGRIYGRHDELSDRTDAMPDRLIAQLIEKSRTVMVRDASTKVRLSEMSDFEVLLAGCPTLFLPQNQEGQTHDGRVLLSLRHPARMSVPPRAQWRVADEVRRLIAQLKGEFGNVTLVCHDYADIEFASGFPETPLLYFDDVDRYIEALRRCRLNVSYRLHAFLPCIAFGTPTVHISYDERGQSMLSTIGMSEWDVDMTTSHDVVADVMDRVRGLDRFEAFRDVAMQRVAAMRKITTSSLQSFAEQVAAYRRDREE